MLWCERQGGPAVPENVAKRIVPPTVQYLDNRFEVIQGQDNLSFTKLRKGSSTTNCVTDCCHTLLFVENPFYQGNALAVFPEVSSWHGLKTADFQMYFWVKDIHEENFLKLEPKLCGMYVDHTAPTHKHSDFVNTLAGSLETWEPPDHIGWKAFKANQSIEPLPGPGIQFKDLVRSQSPTVLGLVESDESHCKTCVYGPAPPTQAEGMCAEAPKMFVRHVSYNFKLSRYDDVVAFLKSNAQEIRSQPGVMKLELSICPSGRLGAYYTFSDFHAFKAYMESEYYIKLKSSLMSQPFLDNSKEPVVFVGFAQPM